METSKYGVWPKTEEEFIAYVREQLNGPKGKEDNDADYYNSTAEALANITIAAHNYAAYYQGNTNFQSGWAQMKFLSVVRGIEGPFAIIDSNELLYPQYDVAGKVNKWLKEWEVALAPKAKELLETKSDMAHPDVVAHWRKLAALTK